MKLLNEIVEDCVKPDMETSNILRKCLVLSYKLDNQKLRAWVNNELDGYSGDNDLPDYRIVRATAKGLFVGPFGSQIREQPLQSYVMKKEHQHFAEEARLVQPLASYEPLLQQPGKDKGTLGLDWPANLTAMYQNKFIEGYALNRAHIEIPLSSVTGLIDTVRNRALRFALEIQKEIGVSEEDISKIPQDRVDQIVNNYIYGGNVVISGSNTHCVTQIGRINIAKDDRHALEAALVKHGLQHTDINNLLTAIEEDNAEEKTASIGTRTINWISHFAGKVVEAGGVAGAEQAVSLLKQYVSDYLGIP